MVSKGGFHLEKNGSNENNSVKESQANYTYESYYTDLTSTGVQLVLVKNNPLLEQLFPDGQIWQYKDQEGKVKFIIDSPTKTGDNAVVDGKITDKIVIIETEYFDYTQNNEEERLILSSTSFKDVALCCNQKFYLAVFRQVEGELSLIYEQELNIGQTNVDIVAFLTRDLNRDGKEDLLELQFLGDSYTGLYTKSVYWYLFKNGNFRKAWSEILSLDTTYAGTIKDEEKENYQASFDLLYQSNSQYPQIKVVKTYTKRKNKEPFSPEEIIYYVWDESKEAFLVLNR